MDEKKTWTDQPDIVTTAAIIATGYDSGGIHWEVRHKPDSDQRHAHQGPYYVSQGNLFGSQTLLCDGPLVAFAVLHMIGNREDGAPPRPVPKGAALLANAKNAEDT